MEDLLQQYEPGHRAMPARMDAPRAPEKEVGAEGRWDDTDARDSIRGHYGDTDYAYEFSVVQRKRENDGMVVYKKEPDHSEESMPDDPAVPPAAPAPVAVKRERNVRPKKVSGDQNRDDAQALRAQNNAELKKRTNDAMNEAKLKMSEREGEKRDRTPPRGRNRANGKETPFAQRLKKLNPSLFLRAVCKPVEEVTRAEVEAVVLGDSDEEKVRVISTTEGIDAEEARQKVKVLKAEKAKAYKHLREEVDKMEYTESEFFFPPCGCAPREKSDLYQGEVLDHHWLCTQRTKLDDDDEERSSVEPKFTCPMRLVVVSHRSLIIPMKDYPPERLCLLSQFRKCGIDAREEKKTSDFSSDADSIRRMLIGPQSGMFYNMSRYAHDRLHTSEEHIVHVTSTQYKYQKYDHQIVPFAPMYLSDASGAEDAAAITHVVLNENFMNAYGILHAMERFCAYKDILGETITVKEQAVFVMNLSSHAGKVVFPISAFENKIQAKSCKKGSKIVDTTVDISSMNTVQLLALKLAMTNKLCKRALTYYREYWFDLLMKEANPQRVIRMMISAMRALSHRQDSLSANTDFKDVQFIEACVYRAANGDKFILKNIDGTDRERGLKLYDPDRKRPTFLNVSEYRIKKIADRFDDDINRAYKNIGVETKVTLEQIVKDTCGVLSTAWLDCSSVLFYDWESFPSVPKRVVPTTNFGCTVPRCAVVPTLRVEEFRVQLHLPSPVTILDPDSGEFSRKRNYTTIDDDVTIWCSTLSKSSLKAKGFQRFPQFRTYPWFLEPLQYNLLDPSLNPLSHCFRAQAVGMHFSDLPEYCEAKPWTDKDLHELFFSCNVYLKNTCQQRPDIFISHLSRDTLVSELNAKLIFIKADPDNNYASYSGLRDQRDMKNPAKAGSFFFLEGDRIPEFVDIWYGPEEIESYDYFDSDLDLPPIASD